MIDHHATPPTDSGWSPGARRILAAAAELFAMNGHSATSTRDIAAAVGVSQPAIYKHFPTKDAILAALARLGLEYPLALAIDIKSVPAPAAVRLYCVILRSLQHFHQRPYVLASILITPELRKAQFANEQLLFDRFEGAVVELIRDGRREGDLRAVDPLSGARLVISLFDTLAVPRAAVHPMHIADFALAGLLSDSARLSEVRRAATALIENRKLASEETFSFESHSTRRRVPRRGLRQCR